MAYGVAVTDIDGDGSFEMVVAGYQAANLALKWDGSQVRNTPSWPRSWANRLAKV
jgi:hypothetical protein